MPDREGWQSAVVSLNGGTKTGLATPPPEGSEAETPPFRLSAATAPNRQESRAETSAFLPLQHFGPRLIGRGASLAADDFTHLEDRQKHAKHDAADDDTKKDHQERFQERRQPAEHGFDLIVIKVGNTVHHLINLSGFLSGLKHSHEHSRKDSLIKKGIRKRFAFFDKGPSV